MAPLPSESCFHGVPLNLLHNPVIGQCTAGFETSTIYDTLNFYSMLLNLSLLANQTAHVLLGISRSLCMSLAIFGPANAFFFFASIFSARTQGPESRVGSSNNRLQQIPEERANGSQLPP